MSKVKPGKNTVMDCPTCHTTFTNDDVTLDMFDMVQTDQGIKEITYSMCPVCHEYVFNPYEMLSKKIIAGFSLKC